MASLRSARATSGESKGRILAYGCDMTLDENPYEVGYGYKWMVELEQEQDFIGRDELRKISEQGVSRKLVGVEMGRQTPRVLQRRSFPDFLVVAKAGEAVGKLTSACWSPRLKKNIGYAMVPAELAELGTELEVQRPEGVLEAVVADRVFFRPEHARRARWPGHASGELMDSQRRCLARRSAPRATVRSLPHPRRRRSPC